MSKVRTRAMWRVEQLIDANAVELAEKEEAIRVLNGQVEMLDRARLGLSAIREDLGNPTVDISVAPLIDTTGTVQEVIVREAAKACSGTEAEGKPSTPASSSVQRIPVPLDVLEKTLTVLQDPGVRWLEIKPGHKVCSHCLQVMGLHSRCRYDIALDGLSKAYREAVSK